MHESAFIDDRAKIDNDCYVWLLVLVCTKACIGENVSLEQNIFIGNQTVTGKNSKIRNNAFV